MVYKIDISGPAKFDTIFVYERICEDSPTIANKWVKGLQKAIDSLKVMPYRCPVIAESEELGFEVRHLLFGKRSGAYRILFVMDEESDSGPVINVLRIWHGARDGVTVEDFLI